MMHGYPPAIIRTEDKENYYRALRLADGGEIDPFIEYVGMQLLRSMEIYQRGAMGEEIEEEDDIDKRIAMFKAEIAIAQEPNLEVRRSPENIRKVVEKSILPLLKNILRKLEKFDDLFIEKEISFRSDLRKIKSIDDIKKDIWEINWDNREIFSVGYSWKAFKGEGAKPFDYEARIHFLFLPLVYDISSERKSVPFLRKGYNQFLVEEEISYITREIVEEVLDDINGEMNRS
jgi:hypothetical protein